MAVLYIRDKDGNFVPIPSIKGKAGENGKSAYEQAKEGGYKGTEEEFNGVLNNALTSLEKTDEHYSNFDNPHKVTASQSGALPITGGTLTGSVLGLGGGIGQVIGDENYSAIVGAGKDNPDNKRMLRVINPDSTNYMLKDAAQLVISEGEAETVYNLYGEHNVAEICKVKKSTYNGGNGSGENCKNILLYEDIGFIPKVIIIQAPHFHPNVLILINGATVAAASPVYGASSDAITPLTVSWNENSVTWYAAREDKEYYQFNAAGTYNYVAIG